MSVQGDLFSFDKQPEVDRSRITWVRKEPMYAKNLHVLQVAPDVSEREVAQYIESEGKDDLHFGYWAMRLKPDLVHVYVYTD